MDSKSRIGLIQKIKAALKEKTLAEINFLLKETGASFINFGGGYDADTDFDFNKDKYLFEQLAESSNDSILKLNSSLFEEFTAAIQTNWEPNRFHLFLSHSSKDKIYLSSLKNDLQKLGIEGFLAHEDIDPSEEWLKEIETRLDTADATAAIITDNFRESKWTDHEIGYAICRRQLIVPVMFEKNIPYGLMSKFQGLRGKIDDTKYTAKEILEVLLRNHLSKDKMIDALVDSFCASRSFNEAMEKSDILVGVKDWSSDRLRKIESAMQSNDQIYRAWKVPEKIEKILKANST